MNNKLNNDNQKIVVLSIIFLIESKRRKKGIFFDFRSDPDTLFCKTDPQIQIQIKMKWIHNTIEKLPKILKTKYEVKHERLKKNLKH